MATQLQLRRGTTSQIAAFTGANGEIAVDTDVKTIYVQDGATAGGFAMARADFSNISASASLTLGTLNATTLNVTTLDLTTLEVTTIKAKDGTAAGSIADSTGVVTIASAVLTTADINGGTFDGIVGGTTPAAGSFTSLTASTSLTISTSDNTTQLSLISTDGDSSAGPVLEMYRNSGTPTANDAAGLIYFYGENDADEKIAYGQIYTQIKDASDGSEDGSITLYTMAGGTSTQTLTLESGNVKIPKYLYLQTTDDQANAWLAYTHTDDTLRFNYNGSGNDEIIVSTSGNVGINDQSPPEKLAVTGAILAEGDHATSVNAMGATAGILLHASSPDVFVTATSSGSNNRNMQLRALNAGAANANQLFLEYTGNVGIGTGSPGSYYADDLVVAAPDEGGITIASGATTHRGMMAFADATSGDGRYAGYVAYDHNTDAMSFHGGGAGAKRLNIDNNGYVTMPSQPAASYGYSTSTLAGAYGYDWGSTGTQVNAVCKPNVAQINRGSIYNSSTGVFTAPVAGVYQYNISGNLYTLYVADGTYYTIVIEKNEVFYKYEYHTNENNSSTWYYHNYGGIIELAADDEVTFKLRAANLTTAQGGFGFDTYTFVLFNFQLLY